MELMRQGAMLTVLSTLLAALAWPATLLAATDFIDSSWTIAIDRFSFYFDGNNEEHILFAYCFLYHCLHIQRLTSSILYFLDRTKQGSC